MKLDRPVRFGAKVQPICLPTDLAIKDYSGSLATIAGWGRIGERKNVSSLLRSVIVPVWSTKQCYESNYEQIDITENMICAGFHDGERDACMVCNNNFV